MQLFQLLPSEALKIVLVLFLSFLVGLEREEHKATSYSFGGVRTFPLIGLIGFSIALLSGPQLMPLVIGLAVVAAFLLLSYWHKLSAERPGGVTTEMSGIATFLVGALICNDHFWIATALAVANLLLLDLKEALEKLANNIAPGEIFTFAKFLLLSAVILPTLPNQEFGPFHVNPFKTWLVVVAISAISYGSYVLQKLTKGQGGIVLAAILGGAYSSTVTTVVMAKRAKNEYHPHLFSGGMLIACGMMYLRLTALLALFNRQLLAVLLMPFLALACGALAVGWLWSRRADGNIEQAKREFEPKNPLELLTAFMFAGLFMAMLIITQLAVTHLGQRGVNVLAAIMGVADVDPLIMGLTQDAGRITPVSVAAGAILIAAASNNAAKGIYAYSLADRKTGLQGLLFLVGLAVAGLVPLIWFL
jgi:Predicted membrane protein